MPNPTPGSQSLRRVRRLLLPGLALLALPLLLALPRTLVPVAAQTPVPTVTMTAIPTSAPTITPTSPISVVDDPTLSRLVAFFQQSGLGLTLLLLVGIGVLVVFRAILAENLKALGTWLNLVPPLRNRVAAWRNVRPGLRAYLDWLKREYGQLPQIGIATEQVTLELTAVHVPLRVVERAEIEVYQRSMRGEVGGSRRQASWQEPDDTHAPVPIFTLLSDAQQLQKQRQQQQNAARRRRSRQRQPRLDDVDAAELTLPHTTRCLLLLGDAGSGKTTTLRYAALRCAEAYRKRKPQVLADDLGLAVPTVPLPIYVRLTHFAATLPDNIDDLPLRERQPYIGAPPRLFLEWLDCQAAEFCNTHGELLSAQITQKGHVLLLLDGLDEAGSEARRAYLTELICNLAKAYPAHRYVVASRTAGYGGRVHLADFLERHLSPLNAAEARSIIKKWFTAVDQRLTETGRTAHAEDASAQTAKLWDVIERNPRLFEMATNPLLVTAMALLQFNNVQLPDQRARLYDKLVELLLDLWQKQKRNDLPERSVARLATEQRRIEALALAMQQQPQQVREVTLHQACAWLSPLYVGRGNIDREEVDRRVQQLLESLALDSGLLQRRENGYSFSHYTFQEYLAARALDGMDTTDPQTSVRFLLERSTTDRWRETLLLAAGHWSNGQQLNKTILLIEGLLAQQTAAACLLAGEALADIGLGDEKDELAPLRTTTAERLHELAFQPQRCPDPRMRNTAAELLDRLEADQRPELHPDHPRYWADRIEPGPFVMGDDQGKYDDEKPAFVYRITRPYALAHYPVTNRQYLCFLEDLERQGRADEAQQRRPREWPGRRYRAGTGNHPVVNVDWYDATAFAAWANATWLTDEQRARGEQIRLPTEPEWERAAAYPLTIPPDNPGGGRGRYPWGDTLPDLTDTSSGSITGGIRGNTKESGIGGTSVVGIFPDGAAACGAEDLAGNVWEWCSTRYQSYPLAEEVRAATLETIENQEGQTFVVRGGAYWNDLSGARCGCRLHVPPRLVYRLNGVRLARLFSL